MKSVLDQEEIKNYEVSLVGAGLGGGFNHNSALHVMKYEEAINGSDGEAWKQEVKNENKQMIKHKVLRPVKKSQVSKDTRILGSV